MEKEKKTLLPEKLQDEIFRFFLKTSIPRIARERRNKKFSEKGLEKNLSEKKGQEPKC